MFDKYLTYIKDNPKGYWFKRKCYGWGWTPATREGFFVIGIYILVVLYFVGSADTTVVSQENFISILSPLVIATIILIIICYKKGETPKWQWGIENSSEDKREK